MMTSSLGLSIARTTFCLAALMMSIPTSTSATWEPAYVPQQQGYPVTPDPYFKPKSTVIRKPLSKPTLIPMDPEPESEPAPLWSAPQTNVAVPGKSSQSQVVWEAPRTDVSSTQLKPLTRDSTLGSSQLEPMQIPGKNLGLQPMPSNQSGSIIRENNLAKPNDFNPDTFGNAMKPKTRSKGGNSFGGIAQSPSDASSGILADNSFQTKATHVTPVDPLKETHVGSPWNSPEKTTTESPSVNSTNKNPNPLSETLGLKPAPSDEVMESGQQSFEPGKILALVGGEPIFVGDLLFEINQMIEKFMPTAPASVKERERQKMIPQMLNRFVESKILYLGTLKMLPEEANIEDVIEQASKEFDDKALEKMIKNSGLKSPAEFDANLRAMGSSLRQLRRSWAQDQLTKYFLAQQLKQTEEVTHQEMLDSYRENLETYAIPAKCRWEQLMIRFDRTESRDVARQTIAKLENEVVYGANFSAVAKNNSHGFMASSGGQHDWTSKGALVLKEVDEAIFSLPVGELSDIIESPNGFHVIRVIERTEATRTPFLEAQVEIKERIETKKRELAFTEHVDKLKREIPVEYFVNDDAKANVASVSQPDSIR